MTNPTGLPPKEDVAKEIGKLANTLSNEMQTAAVKKARELGFDLQRGRLSLEETLINLSHNRDLLIDAAQKSKLPQLPLKVQYTHAFVFYCATSYSPTRSRGRTIASTDEAFVET
jgi:hypothetical protein